MTTDRKTRRSRGKELRKAVPRSSHADFVPDPDRADAADLVAAENEGRLDWLIPTRHLRMSESAFTFYRGSAAIMAHDLSGTPASGISVQLCGDAHLSNFGIFGSPERQLIFDLNDFDETLPGPWEWDVKRLAPSFVIAARHREFDDRDVTAASIEALSAYCRAVDRFSQMRSIDVWYAQARVEDLADLLHKPGSKARKRVEKKAKKVRAKDSRRAMRKLAEVVDGQLRISTNDPRVIPLRTLPLVDEPDQLRQIADESLAQYRRSLPPSRRVLLDRYQLVDLALRVGGVGSVGTRCLTAMLVGATWDDPLFLQIKEAGSSVLESFLPASEYHNDGQRVVEGQRLMQASSDIFLGWTHSELTGRDYYWRQLWDMKGSIDVAKHTPERLHTYARMCGWTLAKAHARSGDPVGIAGYLGQGRGFIEAVTEFALVYADQNDRDFASFQAAIANGRLAVADNPQGPVPG